MMGHDRISYMASAAPPMAWHIQLHAHSLMWLVNLSDNSVELADGFVGQQLVEQHLEIRGGNDSQVLR